MRRIVLTILTAGAVVGALTSCAGADSAAPMDLGPDAVIIDVRTPAEHAAGHLDGALLLDLAGGELAAALPGLDPDGEYLVYCRSGNRAGAAIDLMTQAGFTDLTNLGTLENAATVTGLLVTVGD